MNTLGRWHQAPSSENASSERAVKKNRNQSKLAKWRELHSARRDDKLSLARARARAHKGTSEKKKGQSSWCACTRRDRFHQALGFTAQLFFIHLATVCVCVYIANGERLFCRWGGYGKARHRNVHSKKSTNSKRSGQQQQSQTIRKLTVTCVEYTSSTSRTYTTSSPLTEK